MPRVSLNYKLSILENSYDRRGGHGNFPNRGEAGQNKKNPGPSHDFGLDGRMKSGAAQSN